jgi:hypothetical protein
MKYLNFRYIYPPRPEYPISSDQLYKYEKDHFIQVKMDGSCCVIFIKCKDFRYFGRHQNENLANFKLGVDDLTVLNCGNDNWNVIVGEYMNKNKRGIDCKVWNHKFVIFDILVYDGEYLLDSTFDDRVDLMNNIFGTNDENDYLYKITDKIFRVKTFYDNFLERWKEIIKIDMLEGVVLKRKEQKLNRGLTEKNNISIKCRKDCKSYKY